MAELPDYGKPPVIEVAIGTQFAPIAELTAAHIGLYWSTIRKEFSRVEEHPPILHVVEAFGPPHPQRGPTMELLSKPELPRIWFVDSSGSRLIQVQRDRFLHNWRKTREEDEYPRFPVVRDDFMGYWEQFRKFLGDHGLPGPQVDQCELTYVNHIRRGSGWDSMADLDGLFTMFKWSPRSGFLPEPEWVRWSTRFLLPEGAGRLYVEMAPVRVPPENTLAVSLALTARGLPAGPSAPEALSQWLELAREWIVRGFADLVGEKTDALWERRQ